MEIWHLPIKGIFVLKEKGKRQAEKSLVNDTAVTMLEGKNLFLLLSSEGSAAIMHKLE